MATALYTVKRFFPEVTQVEDATRDAVIEVTPQDTASKGVKNHETCAMAVACKRKFHLDGVVISRSTAYLVKGKKARRFTVPSSTSREVVSFDRGAGFAPGTYLLSPISKSNKIGHRQSRSNKETGVGPKKKLRHLTTNIRTTLGGEHPENE